MKTTNLYFLKSLFAGLLSSFFIQAVIYSTDYFFDGYWTLPELPNFIFVSIISGFFFGGFWYALIKAFTKNEF
jgi:hypothetical protein